MIVVRQKFPLDLLILDRNSDQPMYRQLYVVLRNMIETHILPRGIEVPSTRELAAELNIARNTIIAAYDQLLTEGFLLARANARPIVVDLPKRESAVASTLPSKLSISERGKALAQQTIHHGSPGLFAFHPGMPDAMSFPYKEWSKILMRRASQRGENLFGTYHVTGLPALREAIATYLRGSRGVECTADQVVVTTGAQAGFDLLARLLLDPGDHVWMEEPGYFGAQAAFITAGGQIVALNVDMKGWKLDLPTGLKPRIFFVTPACQHPFGLTMSIEQRVRLLELAQASDAWVIEDDYDGEYRFDGRPVPSLQGMDRSSRVIYVGTFAKILFPALRLGYMVLPHSLIDKIASALSTTGQFAALLLQAAVADFINDGLMSRHLSRMRRLYAQRRKMFSQLCRSQLGGDISLLNSGAGIQMVGLLREGLSDVAIAQSALAKGVNISPLSKYYRHENVKQGLVLGYAACDLRLMEWGLQKLCDSVAELTVSSRIVRLL
ncbi:MAG: PLP-dependent aminotransferase family protein [Hyphomicrobiales bacterium]|nr:PLP-dependent aminotransferase family protein [Hyphomicrobiales bacterium]